VCEAWSVTFREEHRLKVFENGVQRRIFGLERDEVTGGWRELNDEELHSLYCSPDIIRMVRSRSIRWVRHVARMVELRNAYKNVIGRRKRRAHSEDLGG
jgi:hypothetical protein